MWPFSRTGLKMNTHALKIYVVVWKRTMSTVLVLNMELLVGITHWLLDIKTRTKTCSKILGPGCGACRHDGEPESNVAMQHVQDGITAATQHGITAWHHSCNTAWHHSCNIAWHHSCNTSWHHSCNTSWHHSCKTGRHHSCNTARHQSTTTAWHHNWIGTRHLLLLDTIHSHSSNPFIVSNKQCCSMITSFN